MWLGLCSACSASDTNSISPTTSGTTIINTTPDGDGSILSTIEVNRYALLGETALPGEASVTLSAATPIASLALQPYDLLLIIQTQGAAIDSADSVKFGEVRSLEGAGTFEFIGVSAIEAAANRIHLYDWCGGLQNRYQAGLTQIIRVPQYRSLLVSSGKMLQAKAWDGQMGGILAIRVAGALRLDGTIDATGRGFRGGESQSFASGRLPGFGDFYRSFSTQDGGNKGESIAGAASVYSLLGPFGRGAPANGGGGGNRILAGGGGGGNGDNGKPWTGEGVMIADSPADLNAWQLDPAYIANGANLTDSSGGGRGGYSYSQIANNPRFTGPGDSLWAGDLRRERGGLGGRPVPNNLEQRLFLGGGGGGSDSFNSPGGKGGNGGGMILIGAESISGSGEVLADGTPGISTGDFLGGAGGGGAGGTIVIASGAVEAVTISASGGAGGDQQRTSTEAAGPGGGGGGGYVVTPQSSMAFRRVAGGRAGAASSGSIQPFSANGATAGASGILKTLANKPFGGIPFCSNVDLGVSLTTPNSFTTERQPAPFMLRVVNYGPSPAADAALTLQVPDTAEISIVDAGSAWQCQASGPQLSCQRATMPVGETNDIQLMIKPPLSALAMLASVRLSSRSADPDLSNNTSEVSLDIHNPLSPHGLGGGFSCAMAEAPRQSSAPHWLLLPLALLLTFRKRSSRRP